MEAEMAIYYMNENGQENGDHEVHRETCQFLPASHNRKWLGEHTSCHSAVALAKLYDPRADGCYFCSSACHTR
jgi:hypothetical protein